MPNGARRHLLRARLVSSFVDVDRRANSIIRVGRVCTIFERVLVQSILDRVRPESPAMAILRGRGERFACHLG